MNEDLIAHVRDFTLVRDYGYGITSVYFRGGCIARASCTSLALDRAAAAMERFSRSFDELCDTQDEVKS